MRYSAKMLMVFKLWKLSFFEIVYLLYDYIEKGQLVSSDREGDPLKGGDEKSVSTGFIWKL